ncbi:hypothetical protein CU254_14855 [Amycolatopsis sp. AA4]|uniref:hypothetical protein n=1 Tax=Actinomycetes TaxID=1760 RepID=UPI0001B55025|nr:MULTISPECIES: hypothetical protein [Actinomycetes]ATY11596.1 hypothetical protein CU254_14855 [Amycolatopsis sp. AA4]
MSINETTFAARAIAVAKELPAFDHLPKLRGLMALNDEVSLFLGTSWKPWDGVEKLSQWAHAFGADVTVGLSFYGGSGEAKTTFVLGGSAVSISETISTAHAYALGALLQKPLAKDSPITLSAAKLQELLPKLAEMSA